jgi:hypothetical protein
MIYDVGLFLLLVRTDNSNHKNKKKLLIRHWQDICSHSSAMR